MAWVDTTVRPETVSLDDKLVQAIGDFVRWCVGEQLPIVRGWTNAVSRPASPYVMVTPMGLSWNATTTRTYTPDEDDLQRGKLAVGRSLSRRVQVDLYGPEAEQWARTVAVLFRDLTGCDFLQGYSLAPLTVSEPQELTEARGNEQAEPRWMLDLTIQATGDFASVTVELDFFNNVVLGLHPQA